MKGIRIKLILISGALVLANTSIPIYANNKTSKVTDTVQTIESDTEINKALEFIWDLYPTAWKIEFITIKDNLYYFRIFKVRGSQNYTVAEYNNDSKDDESKMKELIWIWAKEYQSEIRTIDFKKKEKENVGVVYLRSGEIINQNIKFVDYLWEESIYFIEP